MITLHVTAELLERLRAILGRQVDKLEDVMIRVKEAVFYDLSLEMHLITHLPTVYTTANFREWEAWFHEATVFTGEDDRERLVWLRDTWCGPGVTVKIIQPWPNNPSYQIVAMDTDDWICHSLELSTLDDAKALLEKAQWCNTLGELQKLLLK